MTKVRITAATIVVALGGLTATGAALAGKPAGDEQRGAKGKAAFCKRLDHMIEKKQNAGNRLEKHLGKLNARLANPDLTAEQKARLTRKVAHVEALIKKLDKRVDRLQAAYDKHCATA